MAGSIQLDKSRVTPLIDFFIEQTVSIFFFVGFYPVSAL